MRPAIIVVDMLKDNMNPEYPIATQIRCILPAVKQLLEWGRLHGHPVVFACDTYRVDDFIFQGRMKFHAIQDTPGAEIISELSPTSHDLILRKRRFSAFFQTGLERTLRAQSVDTLAVAGVATHICVLMTALDGICHDFRVVILEDCCASYRAETHQWAIETYKHSPLEPLLQIMRLEDFCSFPQVDAEEKNGRPSS